MKRLLFTFFLLSGFLMMIGCGGGGDIFSSGEPLNMYGYTFSTFSTINAAATTSADVRAILITTEAGGAFAGTADGLYAFDTSVVTPVFTKVATAALNGLAVNCLARESTENMLIGTDRGLFRRDLYYGITSEVTSLSLKNIRTIAVQSSGTVWLGLTDPTASTTSLARLKDGVLTTWGKDHGMTASSVVNIWAETDGKVYVCGTGDVGKGGVFEFNEALNTFRPMNYVPLASGATLFFKAGASWFAGGPASGMYVSTDSGSNWTKVAIGDVTPTGYALDSMSSFTRYWVSTDKGVFLSYDLLTWTGFSKTNRLNQENCATIQDREGSIWLGHSFAAGGGVTRGVFAGD
ncbi:MAG: hypothetical protein WA705_02730 [Candidatus Ozemobacteraceae bacterium]